MTRQERGTPARWLAVLVVVVAVTVALAAAGGDSRVVYEIAGSYAYSGGAKERAARDAAIEDAIAGMNVLVRAIARKRLQASTPIASRVALTQDKGRLTVSFDGRVYSAPLDGTHVKVKGITGDTIDLSYRVRSGRLEQVFAGNGGGRVNAFDRLSPKRLRMHVRVHSSRLPKDIVYQLTYARKK